jgi:hypothetical protein
LWAWLDLNQRPHPYQVSRAKRCADRRFPRSLPSVRGEGMRSNRTPGSKHRRYAVSAGKVCHQPVADKAIGLPMGAAARSVRVRRAPGSGQLRRWTGRSAAIPRRLASCHQLRTVHRRRRGGRAPRTSRAWWACAWRWVMRCSASAWLSPACWLCMSYLRTAQLLVPSEHRLLRAGSGWSWDVPAESGRCHMPALACSLSLVASSLRLPFHGVARAGSTFRAAAATAARVWA